MSRIQLVRGLPGSGKSTFAKELFKDYLILEPDMLCIENGVYDWNLIKERRNKTVMSAMISSLVGMGVDVVVSSVMPTDNDGSFLASIMRVAYKTGAEVFLWDCKGTWKNVHAVPQSTLDGMRKAFVDGKVIVEKWQKKADAPSVKYGLMDGEVRVTEGKEGEKGAE